MSKPLDKVIKPKIIKDLYDDPNIIKLNTEEKCGIYFLIKNGIVVYVGQSTDIEMRIRSHKDKIFNEVLYIEISKENLNTKEDEYILAFEPKYNKAHSYKININRHRLSHRRLSKQDKEVLETYNDRDASIMLGLSKGFVKGTRCLFGERCKCD